MYSHILIPTDGSPLAGQAVDKGVALARTLDATVTVLIVIEPFAMVSYALTGEPEALAANLSAYEKHAAAHAGEVLKAAAATAEAAGVTADLLHVEADHPSDAIVRTAEQKGCDLIVMASHGRRGVAAVMLGSQTTKVLTHSKIPVLVLR